MADSVDRVFAQALHTVRRLPRSGSTRPPAAARLRLYGLYKQSIEGDVDATLPRPTQDTLPVSEPITTLTPTNPKDDADAQRTRDKTLTAEQDKWDAWHQCRGMAKTEAKRAYIEVLIQTMKVYAAGTLEARELVVELEFVWDQIKGQVGNGGGDGDGGRRRDGDADVLSPSPEKPRAQLRVLSPVSRGDSGAIVEGEDIDADVHESGPDSNNERLQDPTTDLLRRRTPSSTQKWRTETSTALNRISTEVAALNEQIAEMSGSPSRSGFGIGRRKRLPWLLGWIKWMLWIAVRQLAVDGGAVTVLLIWGAWRGDDKVERWVGRRWAWVREWMGLLRERGVGWLWRVLIRLLPAGKGKGNGNGKGS